MHIDKEDEMGGWIDTRDCEPAKNGTYLVQMTGGYLAGIDYTVEGGWNTSYDRDGTLSDKAAIPSVSVARWFDAPQPPEIPQEWFDEWLRGTA
jgi:hypothetical protein